ncbi:hypothetical protein, partial [Lacticaseibacillus camelliae]|uniref:hypothetical protein n=1 Tax=Lacticaseibacillus camelliae TaxID=381742 RepID=UPI001F2C9ECB
LDHYQGFVIIVALDLKIEALFSPRLAHPLVSSFSVQVAVVASSPLWQHPLRPLAPVLQDQRPQQAKQPQQALPSCSFPSQLPPPRFKYTIIIPFN